MRDKFGVDHLLSPPLIEERLEHAFATLANMPGDGGHRLRVATYGYVSELIDKAATGRVRLTASPLDITLMDEALAWPSLIPMLVVRRIVSARSMVNPATERHTYPWARLARAVGADVRAVKRWHMEGIKSGPAHNCSPVSYLLWLLTVNRV